MQLKKNLYSYQNDSLSGYVDLQSGDFIPQFVKPSGAMPRTKAPTPRVPRGIQQDGYTAPAPPINRELAQLSELGKKKISRLIAAEGQDKYSGAEW